MKKTAALFTLLALITGFSACYYDKEDELYPRPDCDTTNVTFSGGVQPILKLHCMPCHESAVANGGVALQTHSQVKTFADNGRMMAAIRHESNFPMPKGAPKLDPCKISTIQAWINAGTPNN